MWPTYKPISWDKYYAHNFQDKHTSVTSGLAAGITIGVFFTVFLLTFGCRLYSRRNAADAAARQLAERRARLRRRPSVSQLFPPPPYELAIQMPKPLDMAPPCGHLVFEPPPSFSDLSFSENYGANYNDAPMQTHTNRRAMSPKLDVFEAEDEKRRSDSVSKRHSFGDVLEDGRRTSATNPTGDVRCSSSSSAATSIASSPQSSSRNRRIGVWVSQSLENSPSDGLPSEALATQSSVVSLTTQPVTALVNSSRCSHSSSASTVLPI